MSIVAAIAASCVAGAAIALGFTGRPPATELTAFGSLLATLLFASAILERALDVWLSLRMGPTADALDAEIRTLKAKMGSVSAAVASAAGGAAVPAAPTPSAVDRQRLERLMMDRTTHQGDTRRIASPVAFIAGTVVSAIGLRSLQPLFANADPAWHQSLQGGVFAFVDVLVTGTLLAGGSEGIHSIIALYRDSMENKRSTKT